MQLEWLIPVGIAVAVIVLLLVWFFVARSRLRGHDARADAAWHEIELQLKRRADLVPAVTAAVRDHAQHGEQALVEIERARAETLSADSPVAASTAENHFQGALRGLFGVADAYPQLTASPDFLRLKSDLVQTEDKLQTSRRNYNGAVRSLNAAVTTFPNRLVAGPAGVRQREFFEVTDRAAISEPPRVQF